MDEMRMRQVHKQQAGLAVMQMVVHTSQGMMRDARECAVRKQMPGKAAPPKLALHPASSPFCAWAGRGQQGPGRGPLPQAQGGPWEPRGPPGGPLGTLRGTYQDLWASLRDSSEQPRGVKGLQSSWNDR